MRSIDQTGGTGRSGAGRAWGGRQASERPIDGTYLTDGTTLFRVERTLVDGPQRELFVELEDCATLELIFCSARSIAELDLQPVTPRLSIAA
jgi:hypothetical protein